MGSNEINFSVLNYKPNFAEENINIDLPIFTIHGNHDYPSGEFGALSVIDILHSTKYVRNYH